MICTLCPRNCGAERTETKAGGYCAMPSLPRAAKAMLHLWEEPCLVGEHGAGTVFFSGCNLRGLHRPGDPHPLYGGHSGLPL